MAVTICALSCVGSAGAVVIQSGGHTLGITPIVGKQVPAVGLDAFGPLTYGGGNVLTGGNTSYALFWDPNGAFTTKSKNLIEQYYTDVAAASHSASNLYGVDSQYGTNSAAGSNLNAFGAALVDTQPYPANGCTHDNGGGICVTDTQVRAELLRFIGANSLPEGTGTMAPIYFIFTPSTVVECSSGSQCSDNTYCAYHSALSDSASGATVLYAVEPWEQQLGTGCEEDGNGFSGAAIQEPNGDYADVVIRVASHEHSETITDPGLGDGWTNGFEEIGDMCNFQGPTSFGVGWDPNAFSPIIGGDFNSGTAYNQVINGHHYFTQAEWSNIPADNGSSGACLLSVGFPSTFTATHTTGSSFAFAADGPAGAPVIGTLAYRWDFGDGSQPVVGQAPSHTFSHGGAFNVKLTVADASGNVSSTTNPIDVVAPSAAATISEALKPALIPANGTAQTLVTAKVKDKKGNAVAGETVAFSSTDAAEQIGSVTDNGDGTYSALMTGSKKSGTSTITATDTSVTPNIKAKTSLTQSPSKISLVVAPHSLPANGVAKASLTARVKDAQSHGQPGDAIVFTSSDPGQQIGPVTDNGDGTYTAVLTASKAVKPAVIKVTDTSATPNLKAQGPLTATGPKLTLKLAPGSLHANGTGTTVATARVTDSIGQAEPGDTITLSSSDHGEQFGAVKDNGDGSYSVTITPSTKIEKATITAVDTSVTPSPKATASLTQSGSAAHVAVALKPTLIAANGAAQTVATATVTDSHGNRVAGDALSFVSTDSNQTIGSVTDNGDGTYTVRITASNTVGRSSITATDTSVAPNLHGTATLTQAKPRVVSSAARRWLTAGATASSWLAEI